MLNSNILKIINNYNFNKILISISGGQDSIYLINQMLEISKQINKVFYIEYIYIDHQWKIDSKSNILHLINYLKTKQSKISIYQIPNISLEENIARKYRYNILIDHAILNNYDCIITAHTKTDKIETFLSNLIRGTSINGATSLLIHRLTLNKIHLIKPLLNIKRHNIYFLCRQLYLPIWSDITNYNFSINRNRIRYELIPYLKNYINFNTENNIDRFLTICENENEYIKQNVLKIYLQIRHNKYIAINYKLVIYQHHALLRRILQLFFLHHFNLLLNHTSVNKLIDFLKQQKKITIYLNKLKIYKNNQWLYIK
uniref:tRNA(Ile)-lysidine synthase n=1 Tax=Pleonosporium borreri TaxID=2575635 RepID=A0A4D6X1V8_9FLOR|nr:tRNA Ile-lysidine synthetase [Pleonosporium borreri]